MDTLNILKTKMDNVKKLIYIVINTYNDVILKKIIDIVDNGDYKLLPDNVINNIKIEYGFCLYDFVENNMDVGVDQTKVKLILNLFKDCVIETIIYYIHLFKCVDVYINIIIENNIFNVSDYSDNDPIIIIHEIWKNKIKYDNFTCKLNKLSKDINFNHDLNNYILNDEKKFLKLNI